METNPPTSTLHPMSLVKDDADKIIKGKVIAPWKILIYGTPGCGKSTWAAAAPAPFFLDLESGLNRIDCHRTPTRLTNLDEVLHWLRWSARRPEYKTIVIDTVDEMDNILTRKVCEDGGKNTLTDFAYGKGGELLLNEWTAFLEKLEWIRSTGKNIILVGHEQIIKFEDPTSENYDIFQLKIHKKSAKLVTAKMDAVLFARDEVVVVERGNDDKKHRAVGPGRRVLHTVGRPSFVAKNRFGLPETMELSPKVFEQLI